MEVMEVFKKYLRHITKYISMSQDKIGEKGKDKVWLQMSYALLYCLDSSIMYIVQKMTSKFGQVEVQKHGS